MYSRLFFKVLFFSPYAILCAVFFWVSSMSDPPLPVDFTWEYVDKVLHFMGYLVMGITSAFAVYFTSNTDKSRQMLAALLMATSYGVIDEFHQYFVPGRCFSVGDIMADTFGSLVGVILYFKIIGIMKKRAMIDA